MKKIQIISTSIKKGIKWVEAVIKKPAGKRKDGSQKWKSETIHLPENKLKEM